MFDRKLAGKIHPFGLRQMRRSAGFEKLRPRDCCQQRSDGALRLTGPTPLQPERKGIQFFFLEAPGLRGDCLGERAAGDRSPNSRRSPEKLKNLIKVRRQFVDDWNLQNNLARVQSEFQSRLAGG